MNIRDTLNCVEIAVDNPAVKGEFRVFNQFTEQFSIIDLAKKIKNVSDLKGNNTKISNINNPRIEEEDHYYNAKNTKLIDLGLKPTLMTDEIINKMLITISTHVESVDCETFTPRVKWKQ